MRRHDRPVDTGWLAHAACADTDTSLFFPERTTPHAEIRRALEMCDNCPVIADCRGYAESNREHFGIWGGETERARRRRRARDRAIAA